MRKYLDSCRNPTKNQISNSQIIFEWIKDYCFPNYRSISKEVLSKTFSNKDRIFLVLDAGCGEFGSIDKKINNNCRIIGLDIDKALVKKAKFLNLSIDEGIVACVDSLPLIESVFDIVFSQDVLEHAEQKRKVLQETSRVIRRGGKLIGSTSNLLNPFFLFDTLAPRFVTRSLVEKYAGAHFERHHRVTPDQLQKFLLEAPFTRVSIKIVKFPPFAFKYYVKKKKLPWFVKTWVLFDKLTSNRFLEKFKEIIMFEALR